MKKKTLGLIIAGVAAASMIGTGFAAWVITGNATQELSGNITVDEVTDKSITLEAKWATDEDGSIKFIGPETQNATTEWLKYDGTEVADLSETLTLTFGLGADIVQSEFNVTFDFDVVDAATGNYDAAIAAKLINAPTINGQAFTDGSYTVSLDTLLSGVTVTDNKATKDVVLAFTWGTAFGSTNPYDFYNGIAYNTKVTKNSTTQTPEDDETNGTAIQNVAKADLEALNTNLSGATFTLTITVAKKTA